VEAPQAFGGGERIQLPVILALEALGERLVMFVVNEIGQRRDDAKILRLVEIKLFLERGEPGLVRRQPVLLKRGGFLARDFILRQMVEQRVGNLGEARVILFLGKEIVPLVGQRDGPGHDIRQGLPGVVGGGRGAKGVGRGGIEIAQFLVHELIDIKRVPVFVVGGKFPKMLHVQFAAPQDFIGGLAEQDLRIVAHVHHALGAVDAAAGEIVDPVDVADKVVLVFVDADADFEPPRLVRLLFVVLLDEFEELERENHVDVEKIVIEERDAHAVARRQHDALLLGDLQLLADARHEAVERVNNVRLRLNAAVLRVVHDVNEGVFRQDGGCGFHD